ncbi:MAG: sugar kinase [Anaerolineae bacterium]|nr:sugar kinase [Anaerolineae bacterium]
MSHTLLHPARVIALGETMLMLAPPGHELLEHSREFITYIGGSEANVAVGLERLGIHAGWIGKLPRNALGRKVVNGIRAYGVDTSGVVWSDTGRVGTFYVEWGADPRPIRTIYDRAYSAATTLTVDELDWTYIAQAEWLHLTGITPALSATCRQSTMDIVRQARALGIHVSFDLNYRSLLWTPDEARAAWVEIVPYVNLLIAAETDAALLLDASLPRETLATRLFNTYHPDAVVLTCGSNGSIAYNGVQTYCEPSHMFHIVNRLGAGDAFDAGLLYGLLTADLQTGLAYGNAMAALKMTIPQNLPLIEKTDVLRLLSGDTPYLMR